MKKITYVVTVLIILTLGAFTVRAQDSLPMIASRDALRSYALTEVYQAFGSALSRSMAQSTNASFQFAIAEKPVDIERFNKEVARRTLDINVVNPNDPVFFYVVYTDRKGHSLFQGGNVGNFIPDPKAEGKWIFPMNVAFELYMNYDIVLNVSNVFYAHIELRDDKGQTVSDQSLSVDQRSGELRFPSQLAGARGSLILVGQAKDGSIVERIYDLQTGRLQAPVAGHTALGVMIRDVIVAELNPLASKLSIEVQSFGGFGESPTVQLRVQGSEGLPAGSTVDTSFHVTTSEGERGKTICIRSLDAEGPIVWYCVALLQNGDATAIKLAPGLYHVIFTWERFRPYPPFVPIPIPVSDGGGKG